MLLAKSRWPSDSKCLYSHTTLINFFTSSSDRSFLSAVKSICDKGSFAQSAAIISSVTWSLSDFVGMGPLDFSSGSNDARLKSYSIDNAFRLCITRNRSAVLFLVLQQGFGSPSALIEPSSLIDFIKCGTAKPILSHSSTEKGGPFHLQRLCGTTLSLSNHKASLVSRAIQNLPAIEDEALLLSFLS